MVGIKQSRSIQDEKLLTAIFTTTHPEGVISTTPSNLIVDSRPLVNATAQIALGAGSEIMENYKLAKKIYVPIENIHVMRDSLAKVVEALRDGDASPFPPQRELLAKSGWLKHLSIILDGTAEIVQTVHVRHSHVVLHCSDGWDRTSQLAALSQICLDPYYRTLEGLVLFGERLIIGFMVLVEKDFLSFGHMFAKRSGHLSNEKFFIDRYVQPTPQNPSDSPPHSGRSSPAVPSQFPATVVHSTPSPSSSAAAAARGAFSTFSSRISLIPSNSKPPQMKETSPVFHQFLDAVYQLMYLFPSRFQYNERFLKRLLYHAYSCQYGSFLYDSEKERVEAKVYKKTRCVWDYFLARRKEFLNPEYNPSLDIGEGVLFPKSDGVRWWAQAWGRTDQEMNGPGRGTNIREDVAGKMKEERQIKEDKDRDEILRERLERVVRTTSPRKHSQLQEDVGASPVRTRENTNAPDSPLLDASPQKDTEGGTKEPIVEVDLAAGQIDPVTANVIPAGLADTNATPPESSDWTSVDGSASISSSAVEDKLDTSEGLDGPELDPLGGGVEMISLSRDRTTIRNR
jgi:Myotubularin-like phosphatase domain